MKSKEREILEKAYIKHLHGQVGGKNFALGKFGSHVSNLTNNRGHHLVQPKRGRGR